MCIIHMTNPQFNSLVCGLLTLSPIIIIFTYWYHSSSNDRPSCTVSIFVCMFLDKVSVLVIGGMLVVSIPSALGPRLQVLGYCSYFSARLTKLACCPFTCSHGH